MNLLIISKPGIRIYKDLRQSETAWDAIRFYEPIEIPIGIFIPVPTMANALSLASDLKYFIRKYASDHLFEVQSGVFCTGTLAKNWYLSRTLNIDTIRRWSFYYQICQEGSMKIFSRSETDREIDYTPKNGGYLLNVWCTSAEYELFRIQDNQ